jgi:hypothetical protein
MLVGEARLFFVLSWGRSELGAIFFIFLVEKE